MKKLIYLLFGLNSTISFAQTQMTDAEMTTKANQIKNATVAGENTKERFAYLFQRLIDSKINLSQLAYVVASGTDTYTATISPVPPTLTGLRAFVYFTNANTGAATININGLGVKDLINNNGSALAANDITAGEVKVISYNGTSFQLVGGGSVASASSSTAGIAKLYTTTGSNVDGSMDQNSTTSALSGKQATLVSGTNIKTVGGSSLLGSGDISVGIGTITALTGGVTASGTGSVSATVVTNANLTGPITSVGNATSVASQTGTGSTFVMSASPALTGSPTAPTQTTGDNSTKIATTAYVDALSLPAATGSVNGYLTSSDWTTFNNKQANLTQNTANTNSIGGTWAASANNQYHLDNGGQFTARATASDNLIGHRDSYNMIASGSSQTLIGRSITPTFNPNAQSSIVFKGIDYNPTLSGTYTHISANFQTGVMVLGGSSVIAGSTILQVKGTGTTSGIPFIVYNSTPTARFYVQDNGISAHTAAFTTTGTGQAAVGFGGTLTGRASNPDIYYGVYSNTAYVHGATSQASWGYAYVGSFNKNAFSSTIGGGFLFNPTFPSQPDFVYGFVSAPTASLSGFGTATPTSTVHASGSFATAYIAKTALYTLTSTDHTVEVTSGTHTQTLPTAVGIAGRVYVITNSGSGTVTIGTTSSQTFVNVTGTPTTLSVSQFHGYQVQSNGANWIVIASF
jgi:hypothetical protein